MTSILQKSAALEEEYRHQEMLLNKHGRNRAGRRMVAKLMAKWRKDKGRVRIQGDPGKGNRKKRQGR